MGDENETKTRRFKLIHLETLLLTLETLAVCLLLPIFPPYLKVYCAAANLITLLYSGRYRRPDYIEKILDGYMQEYYGFLLAERSMSFLLIYAFWPAKFGYIVVGTCAMSTICSVTIACNIYLARRRQLRNLRLRRWMRSIQRLENDEEAGRSDRESSSFYPYYDIYIYVV